MQDFDDRSLTHGQVHRDVLIVHLTESYKLKRTRTDLRNFTIDKALVRNPKDRFPAAGCSPPSAEMIHSNSPVPEIP